MHALVQSQIKFRTETENEGCWLREPQTEIGTFRDAAVFVEVQSNFGTFKYDLTDFGMAKMDALS